MGRRVRKVTYPWNVGTEDWMEAPDSDIRFVYDGWNLVQEIDGLVEVESGVTDVVREYTWGLDLSGQSGNPSPAGIHGAGGIGGLLATHWTGETTEGSDDEAYIYFYDANGNVGQMIDVVSGSSGYGTTAAKYEYYPFGGLLVADGVAAEANPFRFSTKYRDNETGCYYYGYRYLRTKHGRWLSRDPIAERGGVNLMGFVRNGPINNLDLVGLNPCENEYDSHDFNRFDAPYSNLVGTRQIGDGLGESSLSFAALYAWYHVGQTALGPGFSVEFVGDALSQVINERQVQKLMSDVHKRLKSDAKKMLGKVECNCSRLFEDSGNRLITYSYQPNIAASLMRFTVYWRAYCNFGPKRCCVALPCKDKVIEGSDGYYDCVVEFSFRDKYDFKAYDPFGWLGIPFDVGGEWKMDSRGYVSDCSE